jgi:hypothetical protein
MKLNSLSPSIVDLFMFMGELIHYVGCDTIILGPILHSQFEKANECFLKIFSLQGNTKYDGIFENTSFVKMESSKLIII